MTWNGAGGWVIFSHARQLNFSRTVWITNRQSESYARALPFAAGT